MGGSGCRSAPVKLEFMVREIDRAMVLRIETKEGKEKEQGIALRNVTMPLIIFMLEHQFCSTIGENRLEADDRNINRIFV